jgi:hypothetical protein
MRLAWRRRRRRRAQTAPFQVLLTDCGAWFLRVTAAFFPQEKKKSSYVFFLQGRSDRVQVLLDLLDRPRLSSFMGQVLVMYLCALI